MSTLAKFITDDANDRRDDKKCCLRKMKQMRGVTLLFLLTAMARCMEATDARLKLDEKLELTIST